MNTSTNFGELRTPDDLVKKLEHDLQRMTAANSDQYAAFDFFITADSIVDWIYPDVTGDTAATKCQKKRRNDLRRNNNLPRITSHIANGAKHFIVTSHNSITEIEKSRYVEKGYIEDGYFEDPLLIHLTPEEAAQLGVHRSIKAIHLGRLVMKFWSEFMKTYSEAHESHGTE